MVVVQALISPLQSLTNFPSTSCSKHGVQHFRRFNTPMCSSLVEDGGPWDALARTCVKALLEECSQTGGAIVS